MKIGYARVSRADQRLDLQIQALRGAGCKRIFSDCGVSGNRMNRPGLDSALKAIKPGGALVVWRLDRLGRSLIGLVELMNGLGRRSIDFVSLTEAIDTSCSGGRLVFHMMAALAEFERSLISERTIAGMAAARANGARMGRPPKLSRADIVAAGGALREGKDIAAVARRFDVTVRTLRKWLKVEGIDGE